MIYDYQRPIYQKLLRAFWSHQRSLGIKLEVKPRPHRLIIGPTGSGKTHLAVAVAKELNWDYMIVNASAWVLLGARGEPTWHSVRDWLAESHPRRPRVLIMDEIDKTGGTQDWCRMLVAELYGLIDGRVIEKAESTPAIEERLGRLMVIGCGAFQGCFDKKPDMGFGSKAVEAPAQEELHKHLPRELVNRFHQEILALPELTPADYRSMANQAIASLPEDDQPHAWAICDREIQRGIDGKIGARFPEALVSAVFDEITAHETPTPWRISVPLTKQEPIEEELPDIEETGPPEDFADFEMDDLWNIPIPGAT